MAELKTFLFTDIVGSVDLKSEMPGRSDAERDEAFIQQVLTPHRERIERELAACGGRVVSTAGDGHFLVFSDTVLAARWAIGIQQSHRDEPIQTPRGTAVAVRISIHLGIPQLDPRDPNNFVGKPVDYAARLNDYATGGQILASRSVEGILQDAGMDGVTFHRHGRRELKGIGKVEIYELVYDHSGPRQMRPQPRTQHSRQWTVLPATMGLTEYRAGSSGAEPAPAASLTMVRVGNYVLEQRLGSGGMGDVYRARHSQFGRVRAVKVIKQHFVDAGHKEVVRRFYQEIKAVGVLEHPNIVVAIDSSSPADTVHYLVMEYIDGISVDELVARNGPLPVAEACEIARQAARGLGYIAQHGMVHRDIKPSNLMLTVVPTHEPSGAGSSSTEPGGEQAVVKILDLGLALLVGDDQQRLTLLDNRAMGTAMYMSPEQWKTTSVDIRADIYSLGCTLYHLLAGQPPFWDSDLRPEKAHERERLPAIHKGGPVPPELWDVLQRMTAKNPDERFSDPAAVAAALAPFAKGHHLARLVRQMAGDGQRPQTDGIGKLETVIAKSAESDSRLGHAPGSWKLPKSLPVESRRRIWRGLMALVALVGVASVVWLAIQATGRRESAKEVVENREQKLQLAARFAASEILKEINLRFDILDRLADEESLQQRMIKIDESPKNQALWNPLEEWLGAQNADYVKQAPADSWFINDSHGIQVARSPRSEVTRGNNFSSRDYFHGQGANLPEGTPDLKPIDSPHLSAVYPSTSTGHLKVAFSVPIKNGLSGSARKIVGVLAMAVDLGEFSVLRNQLPKGHEVVLIDLRNATVDGQTRRGLILHQERPTAVKSQHPSPWIGLELLAQIDDLLKKSSTGEEEGDAMLLTYRDEAITGGKLYQAAIQPVIDRRADEQVSDTQWLVLVQEPAQE